MIFVSNVFCLSIAFAAFVLLMFQIRYEWGYDGFHKDGDRIFRLEIRLADKGAGVLFARPMIDEFIKSSSMIEIGAPIRGYIGKISFDIKRDKRCSLISNLYVRFIRNILSCLTLKS